MELCLATSLPNRLYRLRWVFDFADGRKKIGIWNGTSNRPEDSASRVSKTGLIRASIQRESIATQIVETVLEIDGHEYVSARWEAYAKGPGMLLGLKGKARLAPKIWGLSFKTNDRLWTVALDGQVSSRSLSLEEKKFRLEEHPAGSML